MFVVAELSQWKPVFGLRPLLVEVMADQIALVQVFIAELQVSLSSFQQRSIFVRHLECGQ